jgi:hypothetical protein
VKCHTGRVLAVDEAIAIVVDAVGAVLDAPRDASIHGAFAGDVGGAPLRDASVVAPAVAGDAEPRAAARGKKRKNE